MFTTVLCDLVCLEVPHCPFFRVWRLWSLPSSPLTQTCKSLSFQDINIKLADRHQTRRLIIRVAYSLQLRERTTDDECKIVVRCVVNWVYHNIMLRLFITIWLSSGKGGLQLPLLGKAMKELRWLEAGLKVGKGSAWMPQPKLFSLPITFPSPPVLPFLRSRTR